MRAIVCQHAHPFHIMRIQIWLILILSAPTRKHDLQKILTMKSKINFIGPDKLWNFTKSEY